MILILVYVLIYIIFNFHQDFLWEEFRYGSYRPPQTIPFHCCKDWQLYLLLVMNCLWAYLVSLINIRRTTPSIACVNGHLIGLFVLFLVTVSHQKQKQQVFYTKSVPCGFWGISKNTLLGHLSCLGILVC